MQQVKIYSPGFFKGEAREQFFKDVKQMEHAGWYVHTITAEGADPGKGRSGRLRVLYDTNARARSEIGSQDLRPTALGSYPDIEEFKAHQYEEKTLPLDVWAKGHTQ
jgi:hypothetical protein